MPNYTQQPPVILADGTEIITRSLGGDLIEIEVIDASGGRAKGSASPSQADGVRISITQSVVNAAVP